MALLGGRSIIHDVCFVLRGSRAVRSKLIEIGGFDGTSWCRNSSRLKSVLGLQSLDAAQETRLAPTECIENQFILSKRHLAKELLSTN
jgi:hypothetical protein